MKGRLDPPEARSPQRRSCRNVQRPCGKDGAGFRRLQTSINYHRFRGCSGAKGIRRPTSRAREGRPLVEGAHSRPALFPLSCIYLYCGQAKRLSQKAPSQESQLGRPLLGIKQRLMPDPVEINPRSPSARPAHVPFTAGVVEMASQPRTRDIERPPRPIFYSGRGRFLHTPAFDRVLKHDDHQLEGAMAVADKRTGIQPSQVAQRRVVCREKPTGATSTRGCDCPISSRSRMSRAKGPCRSQGPPACLSWRDRDLPYQTTKHPSAPPPGLQRGGPGQSSAFFQATWQSEAEPLPD